MTTLTDYSENVKRTVAILKGFFIAGANMSRAKYLAALGGIQKLSPEELADALNQNGFSGCRQLIIDKDIDGNRLLKLTEFEVKQYKLFLKPVELNRLWAFIVRIKEHPEDFVLSEAEYLNYKPTPPRKLDEIPKPRVDFPKPKPFNIPAKPNNHSYPPIPPPPVKPTITAPKPKQEFPKPPPPLINQPKPAVQRKPPGLLPIPKDATVPSFKAPPKQVDIIESLRNNLDEKFRNARADSDDSFESSPEWSDDDVLEQKVALKDELRVDDKAEMDEENERRRKLSAEMFHANKRKLGLLLQGVRDDEEGATELRVDSMDRNSKERLIDANVGEGKFHDNEERGRYSEERLKGIRYSKESSEPIYVNVEELRVESLAAQKRPIPLPPKLERRNDNTIKTEVVPIVPPKRNDSPMRKISQDNASNTLPKPPKYDPEPAITSPSKLIPPQTPVNLRPAFDLNELKNTIHNSVSKAGAEHAPPPRPKHSQEHLHANTLPSKPSKLPQPPSHLPPSLKLDMPLFDLTKPPPRPQKTRSSLQTENQNGETLSNVAKFRSEPTLVNNEDEDCTYEPPPNVVLVPKILQPLLDPVAPRIPMKNSFDAPVDDDNYLITNDLIQSKDTLFSKQKVPLPPIPIPVTNHEDELQSNEYFQNITNRTTASKLLEMKSTGYFLLRPSNRYKCTLVIKGDKKIYNVPIIFEAHRYKLLANENDSTVPEEFKTLNDLVDYYMSHSITIKTEQIFLRRRN